ncbi:MAG: YggS family pyridoxal phosphate-dependent enzyme [Candidatus Cloacimonetes bacterium]|nr:YggS family pyridoxal phosphate-dependent enzyme [Candidatus Cloacimonadota bacterium]
MDKALSKVGRTGDHVKLVVVTKKHSAEEIQSAINEGAEIIGENQIQEASSKIPQINGFKEFHFIGHLQSNKIKKLLQLKPALIHSIDKISTAEKLNEELEKNDSVQEILIQINTSDESSKFGIDPKQCDSFFNEITRFPRLQVRGLMTIGKNTDNESEIRNGFRKLKTIFDSLKHKELSNVSMKYLSMGMSDDFEIAIEEGANIIRVGSAIMGLR